MGKLCLSFRIFHSGQLVRETQLTQGVIKIGKVPSAHLKIDDDKVSRMHAIIEVLGNDVSVIDLGSTGGTFVNGQKINKAKLVTGDAITVGDTRIELSIADAEIAAAPTAPAVPTVIVAPQLATPPVMRMAPPPTPVKLPTATQTLPVVPAAPTMTMNNPVNPVQFQTAMATQADDVGAPAVEVAAMLGDSVVGVKHCMDPRGGKVTRTTWAFAAAGLACLLGSAIAFGSSVSTASTNKSALERHLKANKPAHAFRPVQTGVATDLAAGGGLALGLIGLTTALVRSRRERKSPFYRVGTAANVEQPLETAPSASFPLVAPSGDDFVFNYAPGMEAEMTVNGVTTSVAELTAQGKARPSALVAGAIEVPIPMAAKIRAKSGQTTFLISAVNKPKEQAAPLFTFERRTGAYIGGSLAAHLLALVVLSAASADASTISADLPMDELTELRASIKANEEAAPEEPEKDTSDSSGQNGAESAKMALDEGAAGKPDAVRTTGEMHVKNNNVKERLSRDQAIEQARTAGVLGSMETIRGGIASLTSNDPFSSGFDVDNVYGPLIGAGGEGRGNFGMGRNGWGIGGGCTQEPCGVIGTGRYNTIPGGRGAGDGWRGHGGWGRDGKRTAGVPNSTTLGPPTTGGNLDKAIIKRYIKRNQSKIAYCYESELLARPTLEGQVQINFLISGSGTVMSSTGQGMDAKVASCVASVIKNIEFPKPTDGGNVQVNYPFTFHSIK
jgi:hypothetical protein